MPDQLFGIDVPEYAPVGVFPIDPDYSFTHGRKWDTVILRFSPALEQRIVTASQPAITISIGFAVLKGRFFQEDTRFGLLWEFFNNHRARAIPFHYYDPRFWATEPVIEPYRSTPASRINSPGGDETTPEPDAGRYIAIFEEDEMNVDLFESRLRKTQLKLQAYPDTVVVVP